ncbi:MAG: hypothetical protein NT105_19965 [Verrucomicrobia bacterium]|nr:hypothetical protein [Verrucomicrobiota bacterium]
MNCFKHNDRVAVGICRSCAKGLCMECAAPLTNGLACKGSCEERVNLLNKMIDNNAKTLSAARYQTKSHAVITLIIGAMILVFGGILKSTAEAGQTMPLFFLCSAPVFIVLGILRLMKKSQYPAAEK